MTLKQAIRAAAAKASPARQAFRKRARANVRLGRFAPFRAVRRGPPALRAATISGAGEVKCVDVNSGTLGILGSTVPPQFASLNNTTEGSSFFNRIGRKISMKSLHLRGIITANSGSLVAQGPLTARIMVIYDRQPNGNVPAFADLIQSQNLGGTTSNTVFDGINMNNRERFAVLADMQVILPPVGIGGITPASTVLNGVDPNGNAGDSNQGQFNINRFIKLKGIDTLYKASTGLIGDIATGSLLLLAFSNDTNAGATPAWNLTLSSRLKFIDV